MEIVDKFLTKMYRTLECRESSGRVQARDRPFSILPDPCGRGVDESRHDRPAFEIQDARPRRRVRRHVHILAMSS
jgi:hypothetical protein